MRPRSDRIFSTWRMTVFRQFDQLLLHLTFSLLHLPFPVFSFLTFLPRFSFLAQVQVRSSAPHPALRPDTTASPKCLYTLSLNNAILGSKRRESHPVHVCAHPPSCPAPHRTTPNKNYVILEHRSVVRPSRSV